MQFPVKAFCKLNVSKLCVFDSYGVFTLPETETDKNGLSGIVYKVFILHRDRPQHKFTWGSVLIYLFRSRSLCLSLCREV